MFLIVFLIAESFLKFGTFSGKKNPVITFATSFLDNALLPEIRSLIGYSKGGYVLGFYSDPHDKTATYESVSPENMFKDRLIDDFSSLPDPTELVSKSTK